MCCEGVNQIQVLLWDYFATVCELWTYDIEKKCWTQSMPLKAVKQMGEGYFCVPQYNMQ